MLPVKMFPSRVSTIREGPNFSESNPKPPIAPVYLDFALFKKEPESG